MKAQIHPPYHQITVVCSCGNSFQTGSTKQNISVEVCYKCHPLYTGEHRFIDATGRVDKFRLAMQQAKTYQATAAQKKKKGAKEEKKSKSLRELLGEV
ncbi:50S ribosomal protein L31 [Candidatus Roizmanbacteria bacterium]|nr:50S ribosomal protein L31 [Candidatus Roizmanbacteria bacterium]